MCGANSSMFTPPPAHRSPKKRSIASASSTRSRRSSTDCHPSGDDSGASSSQSRLPRRWLLGPSRPCAGSRASPSLPRPSATCGRAGLHWCAASTTAASRSTTIPPSAPCAASRLAARITCLPDPTRARHATYLIMRLINLVVFAGARQVTGVATGACRLAGGSLRGPGRFVE